MKKAFLWTGCLVASLALVACGDSSNNSESNIDFDEDLSSSEESSSSEGESSSSIDLGLPDGARAATLEDLGKYYVIEVKGATLHMATGIKQGLFSFWVVGSPVDTGKVAVVSDFNNGFIDVNANTLAVSMIGVDDEKFILNQLQEGKLKFKLQFAVQDEELIYSVDGGDFKPAKVEQVKKDESAITDAEKLDGKRFTCGTGDTTTVYSFYKGRYVMERVAGGDTISWNAGYADIHRGLLLMKMQFRSGPDRTMWSVKVASDLSTIGDASCKNSDFSYKAIAAKEIQGEWSFYDESAKLNWDLNLLPSGEYQLFAGNGNVEQNTGTWDIYGDVLFFGIEEVKTAPEVTGPRADGLVIGIKGRVSDFKAESRFTFNHTETSSPTIPKQWGAPVYDE